MASEKNDIIVRLRKKASELPLTPGVYLMKDKAGKIIYVGKSKAMKNRVSSYFVDLKNHSAKTLAMLSFVNDFDYILTDTNIEALALENKLIKLHSPRFNIKLKDGRIIGFGKRWERHVDECLAEIKAMHESLRLGSVSCEKNADKGYLAKELRNMGFMTNLYSENMNKYIKISTYLKKEWNNITWLESTDPEYINEILDYNEFAEHDDSPDSAASLLRKMENSIRFNPVKGVI